MTTYARLKFLITLTVVGATSYLGVSQAIALPIAPGFNVNVYANVAEPIKMTFAPDGTLFAGRDNAGGGSAIHRIGAGGGPVTGYGNTSISDPDAVIYDATGSISGTAGSVLVGSSISGDGVISAILPDQSVITVFGPSLIMDNPSQMRFDSTGRLLISDLQGPNNAVLTSTGATPVTLINVPATNDRPIDLAIDSLDRIYTRGPNESVKQWDSSGVLLNANYATVPSPGSAHNIGLEFGIGGVWGTDLYAGADGGEIVRIDTLGNAVTFATGFNQIQDLKFGPDGALYVSEFGANRILRITIGSPVPEPSTYAMAAMGLLGLGLVVRRRKRA